MATAGETIRNVADALALDQATVKSYFREIQKAGLIGKGGRGRAAVHFTSADTARILIAVMGAQSIAEAPDVLRLLAEAECVITDDEHAEWESYELEPTLVHVLEAAAAEAGGGKAPPHPMLGSLSGLPVTLRISGTSLTAEIVVDGTVQMPFSHFSADSPPMTEPDDWGELPMRDRLLLRAIMGGMSTTRAIDEVAIRHIASGLVRPEPDRLKASSHQT